MEHRHLKRDEPQQEEKPAEAPEEKPVEEEKKGE